MQQLPRFLEAASDVLTPTQKAAAKKLVGDSADAAWAARAMPALLVVGRVRRVSADGGRRAAKVHVGLAEAVLPGGRRR